MRPLALMLGTVTLLLAAATATVPAQTVTLDQEQALRVGPNGEVSIARMPPLEGAARRLMNRRSKRVPKGMVIWLGKDGTARYLTDPDDKSWFPSADSPPAH